MDVLLVTLGTAGDVHPFVALGCALKQRGHRVRLVTNEAFKPVADRSGLSFVGIGSEEHYRSVLEDPDVWHPTRGFPILVRELILGGMQPAFEAIQSMITADTVLVAPCYAYGARIASEKFQRPLVTVILQPASVWSTAEPVSVRSYAWSRYIPVPVQRGLAYLIGRFYLERLIAPGTNRFRRELGLPEVRDVATHWCYSPHSVLGLLPSWYASPAPDWPAAYCPAGFVSHEAQEALDMCTELSEFLEQGEAPLVFTPGSGHWHAREFFQTAAGACDRLRKRAVFLSGHDGHIPDALPASIRYFRYAPFDALFPRSLAVVHHGGIGTTAKAMKAGVPQLIMPMAYDQPDNANRVKSLGAGDALSPGRFTEARLANALERLIRSRQVQDRCREYAARIQASRSLEKACAEIERAGSG